MHYAYVVPYARPSWEHVIKRIFQSYALRASCGICDYFPARAYGADFLAVMGYLRYYTNYTYANDRSHKCSLCISKRAFRIYYAALSYALVVEWIQCLPPKEAVQVRFLPSAHFSNRKMI